MVYTLFHHEPVEKQTRRRRLAGGAGAGDPVLLRARRPGRREAEGPHAIGGTRIDGEFSGHVTEKGF